jgi:molybdate-binding protein/DNA-binding XRE family transcriptional regulator
MGRVKRAGRPKGVTALENDVRRKRQAAGLSQQALATRCGTTRQAINAIEAGHYAPSTSVALRLAHVLGCTVEALFRLPDAASQIEAEYVGDTSPAADLYTRCQVARVGDRLLAHPLQGALSAFTAADGLLVSTATEARRADRRVDIDLMVDIEVPENTVVVLGCDPALALLGAHLTRRYPTLRLVWVPRSSLAALRMLGRGEAHAAGTHLWDAESGESNISYVRRELAGHRLVVVTLSQWQQGLIVAAGNPKGIRGPADLARPDVAMVNRDAGSGSRMLVDMWLLQAGIASDWVSGYAREVPSHLAVAEVVASGGADVGPGILAVALALGLDFIPLQEERYDLVIPMAFLQTAPVQALLDVIASLRFRAELEALGGYDGARAGTVVAELGA